MKIDDVLAMAGDHPLSSFEWGPSAVVLVNSLLTVENRIDVTHTGKQAHNKLRLLPASILISILTREVVVAGAFVDFATMPAEQVAGVPPTVPTGSRRMSPAAIFLMIVMSVIGMGLTFSSMQTAKQTGQVAESPALKVVLDTMAELLKEEQSKTP